MAKVENEQIVKDYEELSVANFYAFDKVNGLEYYSGTLESHELAKTMEQEEIKQFLLKKGYKIENINKAME